METDVIKTIIQQALWTTYEKTGDEFYKELYDKWYENYECINITGINAT